MIVTCPSCESHFSVSDAALAPSGRTLRCGRCGHKWHQDPGPPEEDIPLEMAPSTLLRDSGSKSADMGAVTDQDFEDGGQPFEFDPQRSDSIPFELSPAMEHDGTAENGEANKAEEDPFAKIAELMMQSNPDSIPDVFTSPAKPPRRRGGAGLWGLLVVLLLASAAGVLYFFQDKVVDNFPDTARAYESLGIRKEVVGAGLAFSNYQSERMNQDGSEVLVVRGVISNTTDQVREVPLLRLVLYEDQAPLQERVISPPQTTLEPKGGVGFRITLDQPDPHATRFAVTFTSAPPPSH